MLVAITITQAVGIRGYYNSDGTPFGYIECEEDELFDIPSGKCRNKSDCSYIAPYEGWCLDEETCNVYSEQNLEGSESKRLCFRQCPSDMYSVLADNQGKTIECIESCENRKGKDKHVISIGSQLFCCKKDGDIGNGTFNSSIPEPVYLQIEGHNRSILQVMTSCPSTYYEKTDGQDTFCRPERERETTIITIIIGLGSTLICVVVTMLILGYSYLVSDQDKLKQKERKSGENYELDELF